MPIVHSTDTQEGRRLRRVVTIARAGTILVSVVSLGAYLSQFSAPTASSSLAAARLAVFPPTPEPPRSASYVGNSLADQDGIGIGDGESDYDTSMRRYYCDRVVDLVRYEGCSANHVHDLIETMIRGTRTPTKAVNCQMTLEVRVEGSRSIEHRKLADIAEEYVAAESTKGN